MSLALNVIHTKKKFCVLQKKVLSFGPNRTVEVRPNILAEPNVQLVTMLSVAEIMKPDFKDGNTDLPPQQYKKII